MRNDLGVGIGLERNTTGLQSLPEAAVVFDDAVLNHSQLTGTVQVGVSVALLWLAVGGPTGVANAARPCSATGFKALGEVDELAFSAQVAQLTAMNRGDSC